MGGCLVGACIALILSVVVLFLGVVLSRSAAGDREKNSPFECGFDPVKSARLPFSLRFFLLAIIFLIFDVEVVLLLPVLVIISSRLTFKAILGSILFLSIVALGLFFEWWEGSLD